MEAGGNLLTISGAASGDRYNQPSTIISSATGIVEVPRQRKMIQWTSKLTAVATGTGDLGDITANGVRGNVTSSKTSGFKQLAQFSDGSPAIIQNTAVGKGAATHFAFLPGIRFRNMNPYRADPHYNSLVNYTDGSLPYLLRFLKEGGVVPRVTVSATQVETPLLTSTAGSVLTLLNWNEVPVGSLVVTVRLDHDVTEVTAIGTGAALKFTSTKADGGVYVVAFALTLEHCEFVTLPAKK